MKQTGLQTRRVRCDGCGHERAMSTSRLNWSKERAVSHWLGGPYGRGRVCGMYREVERMTSGAGGCAHSPPG